MGISHKLKLLSIVITGVDVASLNMFCIDNQSKRDISFLLLLLQLSSVLKQPVDGVR